MSGPSLTLSRQVQTGRIIVFDVETTGTDRGRDQVIELCMQLGLGDNARSRTWRIKPSVPMSPGAQAVHGISMEELADCPPFGALADRIRDIITWAEVLIGYNLTFDIEMLQAEYERLGQPLLDLRDKYIIDPFRLWQRCEPRSLQHAHKRFVGAEFGDAHSAEADVAATGRVLCGMIDNFELGHAGWRELANICEPDRDSWIGPTKHIQRAEDGEPVIGFGKHTGASLYELAHSEDGDYLRWMMSKDFPAHVHAICSKAFEAQDKSELSRWVQQQYG